MDNEVKASVLVEYAPGQYGDFIRGNADSRNETVCVRCNDPIGFGGMAARKGDGKIVHFLRDMNRFGYVLDCASNGKHFQTRHLGIASVATVADDNMVKATVKGHGLSVGDRFDFYGLATGDSAPSAEPTRVELGKVGNKYMITTVTGELHTWEFGATAKIWADATVYEAPKAVEPVKLAASTLTTGPTDNPKGKSAEVKSDRCPNVNPHTWCSVFQCAGRKGVEAPKAVEPADPHGDALALVKQNGRVFVAEITSFGMKPETFAELAESGVLTLVTNPVADPHGVMNRYIRTLRTADGHVITHGMIVWDYNLRPGRVSLSDIDREGWFYVTAPNGTRSLMNAERVCVSHPTTWQTAEKGYAEYVRAANPFSDRDMRDQIIRYLGSDVDAYYVDGIIDTIIAENNGAVDIDTISPIRFTQILDQHANTPEAPELDSADVEVHIGDQVITSDDLPARIRAAFGRSMTPQITNGERRLLTAILAYREGSTIKRPIRTLMGKRARKAVRRAGK